MQITNSIKICGINYTIQEQEYVTSGNYLLHGMIEYDKALITISTRDNRDKQTKLQSFMHEIMHGIAQHYGDEETNDNEAIIDMFAKGMYQVIVENPAIFDSIEAKAEARLMCAISDAKAGVNLTVHELIEED